MIKLALEKLPFVSAPIEKGKTWKVLCKSGIFTPSINVVLNLLAKPETLATIEENASSLPSSEVNSGSITNKVFSLALRLEIV